MADEHPQEHPQPQNPPAGADDKDALPNIHSAPAPDIEDRQMGHMTQRPPQARQDQPAFHHTKDSVYIYEDDMATQHGVLGKINPGENRWETEEDAVVKALEAAVRDGLLKQKGSTVGRTRPQPGTR